MSIEGYAGKRVLITGGAGFIGSNLARRLIAMDADVTLIDSLIPKYGGNLFNLEDIRGKVDLNITDLRDPHAMAYLVQRQDYIFNLAGQTSHMDSMVDPFSDLEINATAQLSLLEACRKHNPDVKLIFASTRQIYGRPKYLPVDEAHPISPVDINGINKQAGEWYHLLYNQVYGIKGSVLRLTNTYGPGMRVKDARQTFLGIWLRNLIDGIPIKVFGDGKQLRDFNYVDDVVDALLMTGIDPKAVGKVYNLGSSEVISLLELAELMVGMQANSSYEIVPFPADLKAIDIGDYYSDHSRVTADLGWQPKVDLAEGLSLSFEYYKTNHMHYWERT